MRSQHQQQSSKAGTGILSQAGCMFMRAKVPRREVAGPERALGSVRQQISRPKPLHTLPPTKKFGLRARTISHRGQEEMALTHCTLTPLSFSLKQNTGQWDRMFLERGSFLHPPPSPSRSVLKMWEVCLPEPNAEPLKNEPKLAKKKERKKADIPLKCRNNWNLMGCSQGILL